MPEVSVILPIYNVETYLPACLDSLLAQSFTDFELLCVNDGSTDSSPAILASYAAKDPRLKIINRENGGLAVARDSALPHVRGNYISFVDSDDYLAPDCLSKAVSRAKDTNADIVLFSGVIINEEDKSFDHVPWLLRTEKLPDSEVFNHSDVPDRLFQITQPHVWTKLFSARLVLDNPELRFGLFRWAEDYPFTYTAMALAQRITALDERLYFYRWKRPGSLSVGSQAEPMRFFAPYQRLYDNLQSHGLLAELEESYVARATDGLRYELSLLRDADGVSTLVDFLRDGGLQQLGLDDHGQFGDFSAELMQRQLDQSISDVVDVVIPVHNGFEKLADFFERLAQTARRYRLILIDDASDDARVWPYLQETADKHPHTVLRQNSSYQGFLACANSGVSLACNHMVLLDPAMVLPANWLERLMQPIAANPMTAAAFPFSNVAAITGFPNWWLDNRLGSDAETDTIDALFAETRPKYHRLPGGAPCCLGLSRRTLQAIGGFDLDGFGGSDGDGNRSNGGGGRSGSSGLNDSTLDDAALKQAAVYDWCLRAVAAGYQNVLVENLYAYLSVGSLAPDSPGDTEGRGETDGSSQTDSLREVLIKLLAARHPDINSIISSYEWDNPAHPYKSQVMLRLALTDKERLLAEREQQLHAVYSSTSWRITGFLRRLSKLLRRRHSGGGAL